MNKIKTNFNNILQQKGTNDIQEVVKHFQMSEEQTEYFETYLSSLENEIESLKKENKGLDDTLAMLREAKETTRSSKDKEDSLLKKVSTDERSLEARREECVDKENAIKTIGENVKTMLTSFEGSSLASVGTQKYYGTEGDIGHKNIRSYMTILEEYFNNMLNYLSNSPEQKRKL